MLIYTAWRLMTYFYSRKHGAARAKEKTLRRPRRPETLRTNEARPVGRHRAVEEPQAKPMVRDGKLPRKIARKTFFFHVAPVRVNLSFASALYRQL